MVKDNVTLTYDNFLGPSAYNRSVILYINWCFNMIIVEIRLALSIKNHCVLHSKLHSVCVKGLKFERSAQMK